MSASASPWLRGKRLLSLCFAAAFCIIAVMSTCSFLYPTNTWGDAQCFYTVGKSIAHGKVLYRDGAFTLVDEEAESAAICETAQALWGRLNG